MNKSNGICLLKSDNNSMVAKYKDEELVIFDKSQYFPLIISHQIL